MAIAVVVLMLGTDALIAQPNTTWELRDNRWEQVDTAQGDGAAVKPPANDPTLDHAEALLNQGKWRRAYKTLVPWIKTEKESPLYDRGLFLMAEANYQKGDRIRSFYYLDQLMDTFPTSALFYPSLQKQFDIASAYLDGYKRRLFLMPILSVHGEAVEMMYRIQQRSPGSPLAEQALLRTADWYYSDSQFDFAADAYTSYIRSYPRSPLVPRVKLRQAFSHLAQFRGLRFDVTPIIDAREQLLEIQAQHPELAAEENVALVLDRIDDTFARKLYVTGDFYRRTNEPRGAAYTFQYLVDNYPNTPEARDAREALNALPASARADAAAMPATTEARQ